MRFVGTAPWTEETGGYEFSLSEDGTLVHLHEADVIKVHYQQDRDELVLYFRYDKRFAEGLGTADLSVKLLDMYGMGTFIFESVPVCIRLSADEVEVAAMASLPPEDSA
jgi:hypothetical protein